MSVERHAQYILQHATRWTVVLHDDGTQAGMYDLRVGAPACPDVAFECTGAVDPMRAETWNIGPARGPLVRALTGDWIVMLRPAARVAAVRAGIEALLQECERGGFVEYLLVGWELRRSRPDLYVRLHALGIASIHGFRAAGEGKVHLHMNGVGVAVDTTGSGLAEWISRVLRAPERADVLSTPRASGARACHVFVPVAFGGVPWPVESYLRRPLAELPSAAPDLPAPVTAVWITYGANGVGWNGGR